MSEETLGANGNTGEPAAGSPPENGAQNGTDGNPSAETLKPESRKVPFHEMIKDPEVQDFLNRQAEKKANERLAQLALTNPHMSAQEKKDEFEDLAKEFAEDYQMDIKQAKKLVSQINRLAEAKIKPLHERNEALETTLRFGQVFASVPDARQYEKQMKALFADATPEERAFILKSPRGPEYLYNEAKRLAGGGLVTREEKMAGTSGASNSGGTGTRAKDSNATLTKANQALLSGNREEYEKQFRQLTGK